MSIFGIISLAFLAASLIWAVAMIMVSATSTRWDNLPEIITTVVCIVLWIAFIFAGVGINTEDHKLWLAEYEAQKYTIEASIDSETLSGLERIELVSKAAELNGDLAYRKEAIKLWHHVIYGDKSIYDDVEMIQIK